MTPAPMRPAVSAYSMAGVLGLFGVAVVALSAPTSSRELHPGIIGDDDRVRVEQRGPPWDAVGQVNVGGYRRVGQCTGTLIAPDVVLTAAHCVVDPWRAAPFPLHDIHFLAGVHGAENSGHSTAKCLHFPADYKFPPKDAPPTMPDLATDMVEVVLNEKLDVEPMPIAEDVDPHAGLSLVHAAYPADQTARSVGPLRLPASSRRSQAAAVVQRLRHSPCKFWWSAANEGRRRAATGCDHGRGGQRQPQRGGPDFTAEQIAPEQNLPIINFESA